jgi:hypothetical protein
VVGGCDVDADADVDEVGIGVAFGGGGRRRLSEVVNGLRGKRCFDSGVSREQQRANLSIGLDD